ncbi:hypothetical protein B296_00049625 [Ensete ventricosum]|uniref:Uncharacterized protein n=1 Tax=Ensete ventricosum TaxID=4639 RepID=A0A426XCG3_ENSVE|nr:hypothetical protein B296_00049625 [Ensete ventricosum]
MASPHARSATHGQVTAKAPYKGAKRHREHDRLRPARRGDNRLQRDARKGDRLQGACKGLLPAASPAASRRGGRPLSRWLPTSKGNRRLCRGSGGGGGVEGERGLGHPLEKRMILPL